MSKRRDYERQFIQATREAELGKATCRVCGKKGDLGDFISVLFGGGMLYVLCLTCVEQGEAILIKRGERGIEVRRQSTGLIAAATTRDMDILTKRVK